jgi:predicted HTH transcriptional regulator
VSDPLPPPLGTQNAEGYYFEYKSEFDGGNLEHRKTLIRAVASFANTFGGELFLGVSESGGFPDRVPGLAVDDEDRFRLSLTNTLRDCVEPRLAGIEIDFFDAKDGRKFVRIKVPASNRRPHRAFIRGTSSIPVRNASGMHECDMLGRRRN